RWYLFAVGYMAATKLLAALICRVSTGAWPTFGDTPLPLMLGAILVSTWVQAGEEVVEGICALAPGKTSGPRRRQRAARESRSTAARLVRTDQRLKVSATTAA